MSLRSKHVTLCAMAIVPLLAFPAPAFAQEDPTVSLDLEVRESLDVPSATALARRQSASGDFIAAGATLERILLNHADADEARLMHAGILCRLDDPAGAKAELSELAGGPVLDAGWPQLVAACGPIERPRAAGGGK